MINFYHYIDIVPFVLATLIIVVGAGRLNLKQPLTMVIVLTTGLYMVAQSTWFSSWMAGNVWGRDFSNYIWFLFNTLTMVIFSWTLIRLDKQE
jgi:hypothetical protein